MTRRAVASRLLEGERRAVVRVAALSDDSSLCASLAKLVAAHSPLVMIALAPPGTWRSGAAASADVLLLDARTPDALGLCASIARETKGRVLFVEAPDDDSWSGEALEVGARGIFAASSAAEDIATAIQIVHEGLIWARRRVITSRIDQLASKISAAARSVDLLEQRLSLREREVFRHAAMGLGNKQLARRLEISEATVKVHLTHIFQKLGVSGRAELAAAYHGIVNPTARNGDGAPADAATRFGVGASGV